MQNIRTYQKLRTGLQLGILAAMVSSLSGCAAMRGLICGCEQQQEYCSCECGGTIEATCAAPHMLHSMPTEYPMSQPGMDMSMPPVSAEPMQVAPQTTSLSNDPWGPRGNTFLPPVASNTEQKTCDIELKAAQEKFDAKLAELESRFETEQQSKQSVNEALESVNGEVARLSEELKYWQGEVQRLDRTAEQQHQTDMASLDTISQMIDGIALEDTAPGTDSPK